MDTTRADIDIAIRDGQKPMVLIASSAHALRRLMDRHVEVKV